MEGIMIALSILIGCIFIGIELRKGLEDKCLGKDENDGAIMVFGKAYKSVAAVIRKFKEYKPSKAMVYQHVHDGTIDIYINSLIDKKNEEIKKQEEKEKEEKKFKVYVTTKMPPRLLIKYNFKNGDWVQDIQTMMIRTGLTFSQMNYWKKQGYIEIK